MRLSGDITRDDIEQEASTVARLCAPGMSKRVVAVFHHGWLANNPSCYSMDMEYCCETLEDYIRGIKGRALVRTGNHIGDTTIDRGLLVSVIKLVMQLALGLHYIHKQGITHRDLKPRNSINPFNI
jgi:serine/threonine protein kinase